MSEISRVYFDGKELSYTVNGVEAINGEFPKEYTIEGDYLIGASDLLLLTAALNDKKVFKRYFGEGDGMRFLVDYRIIDESKAIAEAEEIAKRLHESFDSLNKRYRILREEYSELLDYCRLPWYKRIFTKRP